MVKTDAGLRKKLLDQRKRNQHSGLFISNKDWKRGTIRVLPRHGEEIGKEFYSVYSKELKKNCTMPRTWGKPDPLNDAMDNIYRNGDQDQKDHLKDSLDRRQEYWVPCIVRGDEGTPKSPNVRIFRMKKMCYDKIIDWIVDEGEELGDDITDLREGRDILVKKTGADLNTKWIPERLDKGPISRNKLMRKNLLAISKTFDVASHFFPFDLEAYASMYEGLTGEELPDDVREELEALDGESSSSRGSKKKTKTKTKPKDDDDDDDDDDDEEEDDVNEDEEDDLETEEDADDDAETDEEEEEEEEDSDDDEGDSDEEEEEEEEEEDSDDEEEESDEEDDSEDSDDDEEEDDSDEDDSDDSDDEDEDEEEPEEVAPSVRGGKKTSKKSKTKEKPSKGKTKVGSKGKPGSKGSKVLPRKPKVKTKGSTKGKLPRGKVGSKIRSKR